MHHIYKTKNTCASEISFDLSQGIVSGITFSGGCDGNLKAIPVLLEGMPVNSVIEKLQGITCGRRPTSCADQLATALLEAIQAKNML